MQLYQKQTGEDINISTVHSSTSKVEPTVELDDLANSLAGTRMSSSKALINVKVVGYKTVKESWTKSYTLYRIETRSTLKNLYEPDRVYQVERRFNDFK